MKLDPATLAALDDLTLAARIIVDGTMFGAHRSRMPGSGLEFSQYRSYQPGDDLRRVDWKLLARSDRYFVRESETETSVLVRLLVDATGSMAERLEPSGVSTFEYARLLAAALALVADRQGDAVGLITVSDSTASAIAPRHDTRQLGRIVHALDSLAPSGTWPAWARIEPLLLGGSAAGRRGITIVMTDGHEQSGEIRTAAARLAAVRHDLLLLHLAGPTAETLPYEGPVVFEELETGRRIEVDASRARAAHSAGARHDSAALLRDVEGRGAAYELVRTDEPLDVALVRVLRARARPGAAR